MSITQRFCHFPWFFIPLRRIYYTKKPMKKIFFTTVFGLAFVTAGAQETMVIDLSGQPSVEFLLDNVQKVTFADGQLQTQLKDGAAAEAVSLDDIHRIYFAHETSGVGAAEVKRSIRVDYDGQRISIPGMEERADACVYALDGTVVSQQKGWDGRHYDVSQLPRGTYLFRAGKVTVKFLK